MTTQPGAVDLREYLHVLRRRKWTIILVTIVVLLAALGWSSIQTSLYTSETRVLVKALPVAGESSLDLVGSVSMPTEQELVSSEPVAQAVIDDLDLRTS